MVEHLKAGIDLIKMLLSSKMDSIFFDNADSSAAMGVDGADVVESEEVQMKAFDAAKRRKLLKEDTTNFISTVESSIDEYGNFSNEDVAGEVKQQFEHYVSKAGVDRLQQEKQDELQKIADKYDSNKAISALEELDLKNAIVLQSAYDRYASKLDLDPKSTPSIEDLEMLRDKLFFALTNNTYASSAKLVSRGAKAEAAKASFEDKFQELGSCAWNAGKNDFSAVKKYLADRKLAEERVKSTENPSEADIENNEEEAARVKELYDALILLSTALKIGSSSKRKSDATLDRGTKTAKSATSFANINKQLSKAADLLERLYREQYEYELKTTSDSDMGDLASNDTPAVDTDEVARPEGNHSDKASEIEKAKQSAIQTIVDNYARIDNNILAAKSTVWALSETPFLTTSGPFCIDLINQLDSSKAANMRRPDMIEDVVVYESVQQQVINESSASCDGRECDRRYPSTITVKAGRNTSKLRLNNYVPVFGMKYFPVVSNEMSVFKAYKRLAKLLINPDFVAEEHDAKRLKELDAELFDIRQVGNNPTAYIEAQEAMLIDSPNTEEEKESNDACQRKIEIAKKVDENPTIAITKMEQLTELLKKHEDSINAALLGATPTKWTKRAKMVSQATLVLGDRREEQELFGDLAKKISKAISAFSTDSDSTIDSIPMIKDVAFEAMDYTPKITNVNFVKVGDDKYFPAPTLYQSDAHGSVLAIAYKAISFRPNSRRSMRFWQSGGDEAQKEQQKKIRDEQNDDIRNVNRLERDLANLENTSGVNDTDIKNRIQELDGLIITITNEIKKLENEMKGIADRRILATKRGQKGNAKKALDKATSELEPLRSRQAELQQGGQSSDLTSNYTYDRLKRRWEQEKRTLLYKTYDGNPDYTLKSIMEENEEQAKKAMYEKQCELAAKAYFFGKRRARLVPKSKLPYFANEIAPYMHGVFDSTPPPTNSEFELWYNEEKNQMWFTEMYSIYDALKTQRTPEEVAKQITNLCQRSLETFHHSMAVDLVRSTCLAYNERFPLEFEETGNQLSRYPSLESDYVCEIATAELEFANALNEYLDDVLPLSKRTSGESAIRDCKALIETKKNDLKTKLAENACPTDEELKKQLEEQIELLTNADSAPFSRAEEGDANDNDLGNEDTRNKTQSRNRPENAGKGDKIATLQAQIQRLVNRLNAKSEANKIEVMAKTYREKLSNELVDVTVQMAALDARRLDLQKKFENKLSEANLTYANDVFMRQALGVGADNVDRSGPTGVQALFSESVHSMLFIDDDQVSRIVQHLASSPRPTTEGESMSIGSPIVSNAYLENVRMQEGANHRSRIRACVETSGEASNRDLSIEEVSEVKPVVFNTPFARHLLDEHLKGMLELHNNAEKITPKAEYTNVACALGKFTNDEEGKEDRMKIVEQLLPTFRAMLEYRHLMVAAKIQMNREKIELVSGLKSISGSSSTLTGMTKGAEGNIEQLKLQNVHPFWTVEARRMLLAARGRLMGQLYSPQPHVLPLRIFAPPRVGKSAAALLSISIAKRIGMLVFYSVFPTKDAPLNELMGKLALIGWKSSYNTDSKFNGSIRENKVAQSELDARARGEGELSDAERSLFAKKVAYVPPLYEFAAYKIDDLTASSSGKRWFGGSICAPKIRESPSSERRGALRTYVDLIAYSVDEDLDLQRVGAILSSLRTSPTVVLHVRDEAQSVAKQLINKEVACHSTNVPAPLSLSYLREYYGNEFGLSMNVTATHFPTLCEEDMWGFFGSARQMLAAGMQTTDGVVKISERIGADLLPRLVPALMPPLPKGYIGVNHLEEWQADPTQPKYLRRVRTFKASSATTGLPVVPAPASLRKLPPRSFQNGMSSRNEADTGVSNPNSQRRQSQRRSAVAARSQLREQQAKEDELDREKDRSLHSSVVDLYGATDEDNKDADYDDGADPDPGGSNEAETTREEENQKKRADVELIKDHFMDWAKNAKPELVETLRGTNEGTSVLDESTYICPMYLGMLNPDVKRDGMIAFAVLFANEYHKSLVDLANKARIKSQKQNTWSSFTTETHAIAFLVFQSAMQKTEDFVSEGAQTKVNFVEEQDTELQTFPTNGAKVATCFVYDPECNEYTSSEPKFYAFFADSADTAIQKLVGGLERLGNRKVEKVAILGYQKLQAGLTVQTSVTKYKTQGISAQFCVSHVATGYNDNTSMDTYLQMVGRAFADLKSIPAPSKWKIKLLGVQGAVNDLKKYSEMETILAEAKIEEGSKGKLYQVLKSVSMRHALAERVSSLGLVGIRRVRISEILGATQAALEKASAKGSRANTLPVNPSAALAEMPSSGDGENAAANTLPVAPSPAPAEFPSNGDGNGALRIDTDDMELSVASVEPDLFADIA